MATLTKNDELNTLTSSVVKKKERKPIPIDEFFDEMELEDDEKARRKNLALTIYGSLLFILTFIKATEVSSGSHDTEYYVDYVRRNLGEAYSQFFEDESIYESRIDSFAEQFVDTTMKNIGTEYYTSEDRATIDAENETNIVSNDYVYKKAIASGRTKKTWLTMKDQRVRHTHVLVDEETVGIDEPFEVGTSELMFPCDLSLGASLKEIANCRCVCKFF